MKTLVKNIAFLLVLLTPNTGMACTVCFGNPDSPTTKAAKLGILFLLGVTVAVLGAFGTVFMKWRKKSQELEKAAEELQISNK